MNGPEQIDRSFARIRSVRVDGVGLVLGRRRGPGEGWFRVEELLGEDAAPATLLAMVRGVSEVPADYIRAEWMFESFARSLADLGAAFIVGERRLPDLAGENLLMAATGGLVAGTAVVNPRMMVLQGDPATGEPGIEVVAQWQDLAQALQGRLTALIGPMVEWMVRHRLRQEKTLWTAAGDRLAESLLWCGEAFDEADFAAAVAAELLDRPGPMQVPLERTVDGRGREHHRRVSCCLAYRAAGGGVCHACPLNSEAR